MLSVRLPAAGLHVFAANIRSFRDMPVLFCSVPVEVGNQTLAAECAASYLLFYPTDEPVLEKMKQYRTEVGEDTAVTAREVVTTLGLYFLALPVPYNRITVQETNREPCFTADVCQAQDVKVLDPVPGRVPSGQNRAFLVHSSGWGQVSALDRDEVFFCGMIV